MQVNSPQPEYTQLTTNVNQKERTELLVSLQQQIIEITNNEKETSVTLQTSQTPNRSFTGSYQVNSVSHPPSIGYEINAVVRDHSIPSPPLSPKVLSSDTKRDYSDSCNHSIGNRHNIMVKASWSEEMETRNYYLGINRFLLQYDTCDSYIPQYRKMGSERIVKRSKSDRINRYNSSTEFEKGYKTRSGNSKQTSDDFCKALVTEGNITKDNISLLPSSITQNMANMGWEYLPDYSPPLSILPDNDKCLKVEWKGASMNLSRDPLRYMLHPAELVLAQTLRLPCNLYLSSKRRLFLEKVHRLKQGMPFRRTDAQKACRIDVNKASRLFAAYERIGWLKDENFKKYL